MRYVAVRQHRSKHPDPISLKPGDPVALGTRDEQHPGWIWVTTPSGKQGWAPESIIRLDTPEGGVATTHYTARELDTRVGDRLSCVRELAGWLWVENEKGESGWVPKSTVGAT